MLSAAWRRARAYLPFDRDAGGTCRATAARSSSWERRGRRADPGAPGCSARCAGWAAGSNRPATTRARDRRGVTDPPLGSGPVPRLRRAAELALAGAGIGPARGRRRLRRRGAFRKVPTWRKPSRSPSCSAHAGPGDRTKDHDRAAVRGRRCARPRHSAARDQGSGCPPTVNVTRQAPGICLDTGPGRASPAHHQARPCPCQGLRRLQLPRWSSPRWLPR